MESFTGDKVEDLTYRLKKLRLAKLQAEVEEARGRCKLLKHELHEEVDLEKQQRRYQRLQDELKQVEHNEASLDVQCCTGAPNWPAAVAMDSGGGPWGSWHNGVQVEYLASHGEGGKIDVTHTTAKVSLRIYEKPFAFGGVRKVFWASDQAGGKFVLKRAIVEHHRHQKNLQAMHIDAHTSSICSLMGTDFSKSAQPLGIELQYVPSSVVILGDDEAPGGKVVYVKEEWLDIGQFPWCKWIRNDGKTVLGGQHDSISAIESFVHFSHKWGVQHMEKSVLTLDVQGIMKSSGGKQHYVLTDPAMCSGETERAFGSTDMGSSALETFFSAHDCDSCHCNQVGCSRYRRAVAI